jgi:hypothetical protein
VIEHRQLFRQIWLPVFVVTALLAVHFIVLNFAWSRLALPTAVVVGAAILAVVKHLGLLGPLYAVWRRRRGRPIGR